MLKAVSNKRALASALAVTTLLATACGSSSKSAAAPAATTTTAAPAATTGAAPATTGAAPATTGAAPSATTGAAPSATSGAAPSAASGPKTTITVGLFGTFGFKEAGLYDKYMALHPNITIKEDDVEQSADYYKALQTHLAANSGLDDIQGIEIGFVADIVKNHADSFVDFNSLPEGAALKGTFYPWKWGMASTSDGKTIGLGTDAGPEAMCYRQDLFKKAGLPSTPDAVSAAIPTWDKFIALGQQYQASSGKPAGSHFLDSAASIFSAAVYQGKTAYDDASGKPNYKTSDGVANAWKFASTAAADKITAGLGQFSVPWNQAFANGAFAAIACPAWMLGYISSQAGAAQSGEWSVAALPGGAANWGGSWLGVTKSSKNAAAAEALAEWLTAPAQQVTMWTSQQHFPSSSKAAADPAVLAAKSAYFSNAPVGKIFGESASKLALTPIGPYDTQIQQAFTTALGTIENKGASPSSALKSAQQNADQAVNG
jgi:cellobiose transport system substrate-binding protein